MDVTLVLTHDCNLGCGYCYAGAKFRKAMRWDVAEKCLDLAFGDGAAEVNVSFFGGEPLLEWKRLVTIAREARRRATAAGKRLVLSVTTNGTLLTDDRAAMLEDLGVYVALSIDGIRPAHDAGRPRMGGGSSFDDVARGLDVLLRRGTAFETISVVTPANVRWLGESVAWLADKGVPRIGLNPCFEAYFSDDDLAAWTCGLETAGEVMLACFRAGRIVSMPIFDNKILAALKGGLTREDQCSLGSTSMAVAPSGNAYPCERMVAEDEDATYRMGNVLTGLALHGGDACDRGPTNDECKDCGERWRCTSFCACANMAETGRTDVAGGTQCWHERQTAVIADHVAGTLWSERNRAFIAWFYGRMTGLAKTANEMGPQRRGEVPVRSVPRKARPKAGRKRLQVLS